MPAVTPIVSRIANLNDLDALAPLFAEYRVFYAQPLDIRAAREFLHARLANDESTVILAFDAGDAQTAAPLGFAQLYPMFSSVRLARIDVLNDLYVAEHARRRGVGEALLRAAADVGRSHGAIRLELETMPDNLQAQSLYRAQGWKQNDSTLRFLSPLASTWSDDP